jgi:hypothetical protein
MTKSAFAAHSQIRNVVLCSLLTFGLAACGADGESDGSDTASASSSIPSLVAPNTSLIDRTSDTVAASSSTTPAASTPAANTTPPASSAPAPGTSTSSTSTVASSTKATTKLSSSGTATLDWMPPTENSDGSVLSNLAGYTVYYGSSPGSLTQSVKISNPGLATYTMTNLPSGTWYFQVTSYSSAGVESARSGVVSTTI